MAEKRIKRPCDPIQRVKLIGDIATGQVEDKPDPKHISTSYAERKNPSMRMGMRRFTRLTNAFSK